MTAHFFYDELSSRLDVPIINAVTETVRHLKEKGIRRAGIMATEGTICSGLFSKELQKHGIEAICPSRPRQEDVTHLIYRNIKEGLPPEMERFCRVEKELRSQGAEAIILGCTELSLIKRGLPLNPGFLDAMEVLAQQTVLSCGKPLKDNYRDLISR